MMKFALNNLFKQKNLMIKTGRLSPCRTVSNICRPRRVVVSITKGRSGIASILRPMPL